MLCPKCGQKYPDGGQRFCDTDGTRLVPDALSARLSSGVFSGVLPQVTARKHDMEAVLNEAERDRKMEEMFFGDHVEPDLGKGFFAPETTSQPTDHCVQASDISAGCIDIRTQSDEAVSVNEFDPDDPDGFIGKTVKGRYQITEMLGEDDSGFAYLAEDHSGGHQRVIVRILAGFDDEDEVTRSVYAEERVTMSHLDHPNVARIFDSGSYPNGIEYVISECIDGLSVDDLLQIHGRFAAVRAARVIKTAAYAISDVQREGVLHRDIRGANIVIIPNEDEGETVKVTNFGVAGTQPNSANFRYLSPEVLAGKIPSVSSDAYSLAVTAYEMLTGSLPFAGATIDDVRSAQKSGTFLPISKVRGDSAPAVDDVFAKAFAAEPKERYLSAREFGDAFSKAMLQRAAPRTVVRSSSSVPAVEAVVSEPEVRKAQEPCEVDDSPAWTRRSPELPAEPDSRWLKVAGIIAAVLVILIAGAWYVLLNRTPHEPAPVAEQTSDVNNAVATIKTAETVAPPLERKIPQPPNTIFFENRKQDLKGDLIRNFVGFKLYYPNDWTSNGPMPSATSTGRGQFLDISKSTPDGKLLEQMLVSYYPSKGTYTLDAEKFPQLVKEANDTLKELLPGYQMLSAGEIKVNGDWQAYEMKFQSSGTSPSGERLLLWGRRIFIPAARIGVRNGFELTLLATSNDEEVRGVDDVGVRGDLAAILYTFEPNQNF
ncbi:MAG: protein kinase [Chloracidobacterium sp.]|nr:protein kinase [Chloracidobacterium sp.]